jgi:glc operon protein GlcG
MSFSNAILGITLGLFAAAAAAQVPSYGPSDVAIDQAKKIAAGSIAHAQKNKWPVAVAVVDRHGFLVYFERMDDTQTGSIDVALDKAKAAAMYRRPTRAFEEGIAKGRNALLGLRGATPITGGVPIVTDGKIIGAVGVSGVTADQDEEVAKAGLGGM